MKNKKILFISLGCDKNLVDSEVMLGILADRGFEMTDTEDDADIIIINTCGFIDTAKSEDIDYILQPDALMAEGLVGIFLGTCCLSQRYQGDILKEMPEVDGILCTGSYTEIVPAIE